MRGPGAVGGSRTDSPTAPDVFECAETQIPARTVYSAIPSYTSVFEGAALRNRGANNDARISNSKSFQHGELHDKSLAPELPLGAHVVTSRPGYLHHGIYVGGGNVVHYAGLGPGLRRGPVEEVPFAHFTRGRPAWVRSGATPKFDQWEVIHRARSRVGEDRYRLLTNNCEHFCEWCLHGEQRSYQVEVWLTRARRSVQEAMRFWMRWRGRVSIDQGA